MTKTFEEIKEQLKRIDEVSLLEVLDIASEDLVERFSDKIEERIDVLAQEFEDAEETSEE